MSDDLTVESIERPHGIVADIMQEQDQEFADPRQHDNLTHMVFWVSDFKLGDEQVQAPRYEGHAAFEITCPKCEGDGEGVDEDHDCDQCEGTGEIETDALTYYRASEPGILWITGLKFEDYGSSGARLYETDDTDNLNGVAYVLKARAAELGIPGDSDEELAAEAARQGRNEIEEYASWIEGDVYFIRVRDTEADETLESVGGFIGLKYAREEAEGMADHELKTKIKIVGHNRLALACWRD